MAKKIKQEESLNISNAKRNTLFTIYFSFYIAFVWICLWCMAIEVKRGIVNTIDYTVTQVVKRLPPICSENIKLIWHLLFYVIFMFGVYYFVKNLCIWFLTTKTFDIPILSKYIPFLPKIDNPCYRDDIVNTRKKYKELCVTVNELKKENRQSKKDIGQYKSSLHTLGEDNKELRQQLDEIIPIFERVNRVASLNSDALKELYKLINRYLQIKCCHDGERFRADFPKLMDEFANSIIRVMNDQGADKYSSVMMVYPQTNVLTIVGSNGLNYTSLKKTFQKGQGFAGSIWENRESDISNDIKKDERFTQAGCTPSGMYQSIIGEPIFDQEKEVIGALFVQCKRSKVFVPDDSVILSHFAIFLSVIFIELYDIINNKSLLADNGKETKRVNTIDEKLA